MVANTLLLKLEKVFLKLYKTNLLELFLTPGVLHLGVFLFFNLKSVILFNDI